MRACACLLGVLLALCPWAAQGQQLWFGPGDDLEVGGVVSHPDYMQLFVPEPTWSTGLPHVDVIQMRAPWFLRNRPERVAQVMAFLKQHHILLAIPLGFVSSETCGQGIEGFTSARDMDGYPRLMKRAGIELDYITMDEPLFYGHDYAGRNACNFPIPQLVAIVANSMRIVRSYQPRAKFVLTEPPQSLPGGVAELEQFLDALKGSYGAFPDSVRFDLAWGRNDSRHLPWHREMPRMIQMLKARGIGYSIIYDAGIVEGRIPETDRGWVASAKANVAEWETIILDRPASVILQSWSPNPRQITPETAPSSMTGFLKWFVARGRSASAASRSAAEPISNGSIPPGDRRGER